MPTRDINQIKSLSALEDIIELYPEKQATSSSELQKQMELNFYKTKQADLIYNSPQIKVVVPKTKQASCFFGVNTRWCTAAKNDNMFADYNKQGPLYIILIKATNQRFQLHYEADQFMDEKDQEMSPKLIQKLGEQYPKLIEIFTPIATENWSLVFNGNTDEKFLLAAVKKNSGAIQYIAAPSEAVQLAAVQRNGHAIQYIKNPTEAVQLAAISQNGSSIQYIKNPSAAVQLAAVSRHPGAIKYITNPSAAVQLDAVNEDGYAIQYIKNPSEAVQLAAVQQNKRAIKYIKNLTGKVKSWIASN